jgi:hypothetical protein
MGLWRPQTKRGEALLRICERAYLADPVATYNDLVSMGNQSLATQLSIDYQVGRLAEHVVGEYDETPLSGCPAPCGEDEADVWQSL